MDKLLKVAVVLSAVDKMSTVVDGATNKSIRSLENFSKKADRFAKDAFGFGASAAGIGLAVGAPLVKMALDAEKAASSQARLVQVFRSMGDETGRAAEKAAKLADSLMFEIAVDDEEIKATMAKLATFENVIKNKTGSMEVFERATRAAFDLQAAGFGDASGNAVQLGKALNDPIKGMTALTRAGVSFTNAEKQKIQTLVATGKLFDAQTFMLSAIEKQVGGVAKATADDSAKMKIAFGEISEKLGTALLPTLAKLTDLVVNKIMPAFNKFVDENGELIETIMKGAAAFAGLMFVVSGVSFVIGGIAKTVSMASSALGFLAKAVGFVSRAFMFLSKAVIANPIVAAIVAIIAIVALLVARWEQFNAWFAKQPAFIRSIISVVMGPFIMLAALVKGIMAAIQGDWRAGLEIIKNAIKTFNPLANFIEAFQPVIDYIRGLGQIFFEAGANMISSIVNGIKSKASEAVDAIASTVQKMRDYLPFSPAKTGPLSDIHKLKFVETIAQSIKPAPVMNAMNNLAGTMAQGVSSPQMAGAAVTNSSSNVTFAPVINLSGSATAEDGKRISDTLRDEFKRMMEDFQRNKARLAY
jgi:phage-related holin